MNATVDRRDRGGRSERSDDREVSPDVWPRLVVAACSGAMLALAYGVEPVWFAAWLGTIPLLVVAATLRVRWALALGAVAGAVASVSLFGLHWNEAGPLDAVALGFARAAQWAVVAAVARVGATMLPPGVGMLAAPIALGSTEFLAASAAGIGGAVALVGHLHALPSSLLSVLGGAPAVAFLVALIASVTSVVLDPARRTVRRVAVPIASRVGAFGGGCRRSAAARSSSPGPGAGRRSKSDAGVPVAPPPTPPGAGTDPRRARPRSRSDERR